MVVVTRNRAAALRTCLDALRAQDVDSSSLEIIVVSDGLDPPTDGVVAEFHSEGMPVVYHRAPAEGLSAGRNRGAQIAQSEIVAYLDDDAIPTKPWAAAVIAAFQTWNCEGLAGRTLLKLEAPAPTWLKGEIMNYLTRFDLGDDPRWLRSDQHPVGANCAIRRPLLDSVGGFFPHLDRAGDSLLSNGEVDVFARAQESGARIAYAPDAMALHSVQPERLTYDWFERRAFAQGRSDVIMEARSKFLRRLTAVRDLRRWAAVVKKLIMGVCAGDGPQEGLIYLAYCRGRVSQVFDR